MRPDDFGHENFAIYFKLEKIMCLLFVKSPQFKFVRRQRRKKLTVPLWWPPLEPSMHLIFAASYFPRKKTWAFRNSKKNASICSWGVTSVSSRPPCTSLCTRDFMGIGHLKYLPEFCLGFKNDVSLPVSTLLLYIPGDGKKVLFCFW